MAAVADAVMPATASSTALQPVPSVALALALGMWLSLTAWVSRLLVPLFGASAFEGTGWIVEQWVAGHAFALLSLALVGAVAWVGPRRSAQEPTEMAPFLAAAGGGGLAWLLAQALWFPPVTGLAWGTLALSHGVEAVMLGSVFGALGRKPAVALALGAGFQLGVLAIARLVFLLV